MSWVLLSNKNPNCVFEICFERGNTRQLKGAIHTIVQRRKIGRVLMGIPFTLKCFTMVMLLPVQEGFRNLQGVSFPRRSSLSFKVLTVSKGLRR